MNKLVFRGIFIALATLFLFTFKPFGLQAQSCDVTPPKVTCPANLTLGIDGNPINLIPATSDEPISSWTTAINGVQTPGNGGTATLHLGQNSVSYTAYDPAGNIGTCQTQIFGKSAGQITAYFADCKPYAKVTQAGCGLKITITEAPVTFVNSVSTGNTTVTITGPGLPGTGWVRQFSQNSPSWSTPMLSGGVYKVTFNKGWSGVGVSSEGTATCSATISVPFSGTISDPCKYFKAVPGIVNCVRGIWVSDSIVSNCGPTIEIIQVEVYPEGMPNMPATPNGNPVNLQNGAFFVPNVSFMTPHTVKLTVITSVTVGNVTTYDTINCEKLVTVPKPIAGVSVNCGTGNIQVTNGCFGEGGYVKVVLPAKTFVCTDKDFKNYVFVDNVQVAEFKAETELNLGHFTAGTHYICYEYYTANGAHAECCNTFKVEEIKPTMNWNCGTATVNVALSPQSCNATVTLTPPTGSMTCAVMPTPVEWGSVQVLGLSYMQMYNGSQPGQVTLHDVPAGTYEVIWKIVMTGNSTPTICRDTFTVTPVSGVQFSPIAVSIVPNGTCNSNVTITGNVKKCGCKSEEWSMWTLDGDNSYHFGEMFPNAGFPDAVTFTDLAPGVYQFIRIQTLEGDINTYVDTLSFILVPGPCCGSAPLQVQCPDLPNKLTIQHCAGQFVKMALPTMVAGCGSLNYVAVVKHGGVTVQSSIVSDSVRFWVTPDQGLFAYSISFTVSDATGAVGSCPLQFFSVICDGSKIPVGLQGDASDRSEEVIATSAMKVFPNPATDAITVSGATGIVKIFDGIGRVVRELTEEGEQMISVSGLSSGVYFVRDEKSVVKLVIVQ